MSREQSQTRTRRDRAQKIASTGHKPADALVRGNRLAEYIVEGKLGEGGAGVVYKARDPDLNRSIAIKLLLGSMFAMDSSARERLVREAQAMAKLCHPNVVTIYHIGTFRHRVFIAMEYVSGGTLRTWLGEKARSIPEILDVWGQAARGLIAAHASGLVHRDFKPDNVLIGESGRVRVTDFGLVTSLGTDVEELQSPDTPLTVSLTVEGSILGTPAYMAPEQHEGLTTDARTDQFSFCVSLYEALYGQRPFSGKTYPDLAMAVLTGAVKVAPSDTAVPTYLRRILMRGLSKRPSDRFDSMQHLLEELGQAVRDPKAGAAINSLSRVDDITRDRIRELTIVERSGRLQLGLAIIEEISDRMDAFGDNALCAEFLLAAGRLYAGLFRYEECDDHLRKCASMAARANTPELEAAAISELICVNRREESHPESAESMIMAGQSAVVRANSDEQRARFTSALARLDKRRGRHAQAQERMHEVLELWQTKLRHNPALLDIGLWAHVVLNEAKDALQPESDSINHFHEVLKLAGDNQHPWLAGVHCNVARELQNQGAYEEAMAHHVRALELYRRAFGEWDERVAMCLSNWGRCKSILGQVDEGIPLIKEGLAMSEQILGPHHLQVGTALKQLGMSMVNAKIAGAEHCLHRCLEIEMDQLPAGDPAIARTFNDAGVVLWAVGKGQLAYGQFEESARRFEVALLPHAEAMAHHNMARLCGQYGNSQQALKHAERSVALNPSYQDSYFLLAQLLWLDPKERARALAIAEATMAKSRDSGETEAAKIVADWYAEKTGKAEHGDVATSDNADT